MSDTISGLLRQKPTSPVPEVGNTLRLSVTKTEKRNKPGEFWNKLKNEGEGYGGNYKVLKVDKLDGTDDHGNVTYSLLIEGAGAVGDSAESSNGVTAPATSDPRGDKIDRAVAFKGAVELVASIHAAHVEDVDPIKTVEMWTDRLLPIVQGAAEGKVERPLDTAESVQADAKPDDPEIPF